MQRLLGGAVRGAREALSSSSSTRLRQCTGVHLHRIDHYSKVDGMFLPGQSIKSAFRVAGLEWHLQIYPKGAVASDTGGGGSLSVDLMLWERHGPWSLDLLCLDLAVAWKVSILDGAGRPAFSRALGPHPVSSVLWRAGAMDVATAEELRSAVRSWKDDAIVVRCDLTVTSLEEESGIKWCLRQLVSKFS